jgi:putative transposase
MHAALGERVRVRLKRNPQPSAGIVDSQSVKRRPAWEEMNAATTGPRRRSRDAKRHLLVDTQGLVLEVRVHNARVLDREGIKLLVDPSSPEIAYRVSPTCGWTRATPEKAKAQTGCRR